MSEINIVNNGNRVVVEKKNIEYINCPVSARVFMMEVMHWINIYSIYHINLFKQNKQNEPKLHRLVRRLHDTLHNKANGEGAVRGILK